MLAVALALALALACAGEPERPAAAGSPSGDGPAAFVGRQACAACHPEEHERWRGSHHDLAMAEATEATVLGDFDDASFSYAGVTSTFFRQGGGFFVRTDGPEGELEDYEIAYTFGVTPLQQYLIAFPGGRYQALNVVWDSRPAADGGQRWVHLYPDEAIDHDDPLHWTGVYQRWNQQCAECHSTNLQKGYDPDADAYSTTWSEIDVACEACHGPGSQHAAWAEEVARGERPAASANGLAVELEDRSGGVWEINPDTGIAERSAQPSSRQEVETCGRCHARRSPIADYDDGRPLLDTHRIALLDEGLYHADGHILDEVYVYGSFLQSKMYRAGVTCTDCHDPHGLEIAQPDAACARCHLNATFAVPAHHFHPPASTGASCVACHMPERDYMVVDPRRDHGFRIPRPDLSTALGTPNACSDCHRDRPLSWVTEAFARQYGDVAARRPSFAAALDAGRRGTPEARRLLADLVDDAEMPGIARATALALMRRSPAVADLEALRQGVRDSEALVRLGAARGAEVLPPELLSELLGPLLTDPVRAVRIEAGRTLASGARSQLAPELEGPVELALAEYVDAQLANAGRPDAQLNLALVYAGQGRVDAAEAACRRALALEPRYGPAYVNLADLYRATGRDAAAGELMRRAVELLPGDAAVRHSLGLLLIRENRYGAALGELARAAGLAADASRYAYVYGVAVHSQGATDRALEVLATAAGRHPGDVEILSGLATISRDAGRLDAARDYARKLMTLRPGDPGVARLLAELGG